MGESDFSGTARWRVWLRFVAEHARSHRFFLLAALGVTAAVALAPAMLDRPTHGLAFSAEQWIADENFFPNVTPRRRDLPPDVMASADFRYWRNFSDATGVSPGQLQTRPFVLKGSQIFVPTLGYPNSRYASIYIQDVTSGARVWVNHGASHEDCQAAEIELPRSFVGHPVRLVAYSTLKEVYIGMGTPFYRTNRAPPFLHASKLFGAVLFAVIYALLFIWPALDLACRLPGVRVGQRWLVAFLLASLWSVLLFYCCYFSPHIAQMLGCGWLLLGAALFAITLWRGELKLWCSSYSPALLIIGFTAFQALFVFCFRSVSPLYSANYLFYPASWTTDNQIPIAKAVFMASAAVGNLEFPPSIGSDRTPLLSCLIFPAATILRQFGQSIGTGMEREILQMCAFAFQNTWILPAFLLLRQLRVPYRSCIAALILLGATPFIFFNTVYVWPKLLAGTLCIVQFLFLCVDKRSGALPSRAALPSIAGGIAAGLAIMSHPAAFVGVAAVYSISLATLRKGVVRSLSISAVACACLIVPWFGWTHFAVPTKGELPRFYLTGNPNPGPTGQGIITATVEFYRHISFQGWWQTKAAATRMLTGMEPGIPRFGLQLFRDPFERFDRIRAYQCFFLLPSVGLLLIPLAGLFFPVSTRRHHSRTDLLLHRLLAAAGFIALGLQFLVMQATHFLHHYPYFIPLSFHIAAVAAVALTHNALFRAVAFINFLLFLFYWVAAIIARTPLLTTGGLLAACALLFCATIVVTRWIFSSGGRHPRPRA